MKARSRGSIIRRGKGHDSWTVVVPLGRDPGTGKYRQQWVTVHGTKQSAQDKLDEILQSVRKGGYRKPDGRITVADFLGKWLEYLPTRELRARTIEGYQHKVQRHVIPALGALPLRELTTEHLNAFYLKARTEGRLSGKGGLSGRSVLHLHRIITDALNYAVKRQYVGVNVALAADTPKPAYREMGILDERGVHQMLDAVQGTQWHPLFVCAIYTGLRRSELLALRWRDLRIDQEEPALTVSRGLHQLRDGTFRFEPPKTASGARDVDLPPTAVLILKAHRERSEADAEILGRKIEPESLVFTSEDGGPVKPHSASQAWRRVARKLGFDVSLHGARHTHASIMLADGNADDIRMVSERLGHASPNITISIYQHLLPGRQRAAAQRFEERLARKEPTEANY